MMAIEKIETIKKLVTQCTDEINSAVEMLANIRRHKKSHIVMHHSATPDGDTFSWTAIKKYHIETNGWADIGYHFGIEEIENSFYWVGGRVPLAKGAHCPEMNMNEVGIGICCVGNYDLIEPPKGLWDLSAELVAHLCLFGGIDIENIQGHNYYNSHKSCPGSKFNINAFREAVREKCKLLHG